MKDKFISNKYSKWYFNIIENRKIFSHDGYIEKHHIIPKSLGGSDDLSNLVKLTAREHFICHLLLVKMTSGRSQYSMKNAVARFHVSSNLRLTSRNYESIRMYRAESASYFHKGVPKSKEHRYKISQAHLNLSPEKLARKIAGVKVKSASTIENMRKAALNRDPSHNKRIGESQKGKIVSEESKQKLRDTLAKNILECPHCKHSGTAPSIYRWHFSKCKVLLRTCTAASES